MKKSILLGSISMIFLLTSCSKQYTCECTYENANGEEETLVLQDEYRNEEDAEAWCVPPEDPEGSEYDCQLLTEEE